MIIEWTQGQPRLGIPDAAGGLQGYRFRCDYERGLYRCRLEKVATGDAYQVAQQPDGAWACTCPAATYRPQEECKHVRAARQLRQLGEHLAVQYDDVRRLLDEARSLFDAAR